MKASRLRDSVPGDSVRGATRRLPFAGVEGAFGSLIQGAFTCRKSLLSCHECAIRYWSQRPEAFNIEPDEIATWIEQLKVEHRDLDEVIQYLIETHHPDLMKIQRLKKRKLKLKDNIARLESRLIPDLDA